MDHVPSYRIAAIPGDGIGCEVIAAGIEVLEACARLENDFKLQFETFDWGSDYYKRHGVMMPADGLATLRGFDAIYFGAVGAPDVPDHITLWGLRLAICQPFDQYANVRPTRILPGIQSPLRNVTAADLDWVIVRENSEGEYAGVGGRVHPGKDEEVAIQTIVFTRSITERLAHLLLHLVDLYGRKDPDGMLIDAAFTHADLAHMVGATRQWITISLKRLHDRKVIVSRKSQIIVRRPEVLQQMRGQKD